jgi:hypothetical protein
MTFKIRPQKLIQGCIPACALSALDWRGVSPGELPTEPELLTLNLSAGCGSGFLDLQNSLTRLSLGPVRVTQGWSNVEARLRDPDRGDEPILIAIRTPRAHCVVVTTVTTGGALVHDPWPSASALGPQWKSLANLEAQACGDAAEICHVP